MRSCCDSVCSTLRSSSKIENKRNVFVKKIEYLRGLELVDKTTFNIIFTGLQYFLDIPEKFSACFYDIAVSWIETIQIIRQKCTPHLLTLFYEHIPCLTHYFAVIVNSGSNSNRDVIQFRYKVLQLWKSIIGSIPTEIKRKSVEISVMKEILRVIFATGHYVTQMATIGIVVEYLKGYGDGLRKLLEEIISDAILKPIRDILLEINVDNFNLECRKLLNYLNMKISTDDLVHSTIAKSIKCGSYKIRKPRVNGVDSDLWVDFNFGTQSISFFCAMDNFAEQDSNHWVSIEAEVAKITWKGYSQLIVEINGSINCNGDALQNIDLKSIKEIVVTLDKSSSKALQLSAVDKRMNATMKDAKDGKDSGKLDKTNTRADINAAHDKEIILADSSYNVDDSVSVYQETNMNSPDLSVGEMAQGINKNNLESINCDKQNCQSAAEIIKGSSKEKKYFLNNNINTQVPINNIKQKLFHNNVQSVLSQNGEDTQMKRNNYVAMPQKQMEGRGIRKLLNIVPPLHLAKKENCNFVEKANVVNETNGQNPQNKTRLPKMGTVSIDGTKDVKQNIKKIRSRPTKIFKHPREKIYGDVYDPRNEFDFKQPKNDFVTQKRHVVSKFLGENEKANFSYRKNTNTTDDLSFDDQVSSTCKRQNIKSKKTQKKNIDEVQTHQRVTRNLRTYQKITNTRTKINEVKTITTVGKKPLTLETKNTNSKITFSNKFSITHNGNENKRKLQDDTVIQPKPKRVAFDSEVKLNNFRSSDGNETSSHHDIVKYSEIFPSSMRSIEVESDSENIQLKSNDLVLSQTSHLRDWVIDRYFQDLSSAQSSDSNNECDVLRTAGPTPISDNNHDSLNITYIVKEKTEIELLNTNQIANNEICEEEVASVALSSLKLQPKHDQNKIAAEAVQLFSGNGILTTNFLSTLKCSLNSLCEDIINKNSQNSTLSELSKTMEDIVTTVMKKSKYNMEKSIASVQKIQNLINDITAEFNMLIESPSDCTKEIEFLLSQFRTNYEERTKVINDNFNERHDQFTIRSSNFLRSQWKDHLQNSAKNIFDTIMKYLNVD